MQQLLPRREKNIGRPMQQHHRKNNLAVRVSVTRSFSFTVKDKKKWRRYRGYKPVDLEAASQGLFKK